MEFIYTDNIDVNVTELKILLLDIEKELIKKFENTKEPHTCGTGSKISNYFSLYNLADRNEPILQDLFTKLRIKINNKWEIPEKNSFHAWLNVHRKDEHLFWHGHNIKSFTGTTLHGYICIEGEPSKTTYVFVGQHDLIEVHNKNSTFVCSINNKFLHKVSKWEQNYERITIGFNMDLLKPYHEIPVLGSR
jgi:hypothetical protein